MTARTVMHFQKSLGALICLVATSAMLVPAIAWAGLGNLRNNSVGGVSISADGIVGPASEIAQKNVLETLRREIKESSRDMSTPVELRMISLKALAAACEELAKSESARLPEEVRFLAGIQRIQYVFLYPEENDIVLAGPGEGWRIDDSATVVGVTTGRPVLRLDDLLVALRYVHEARTEGISCSIDPTEAGTRALQQVLDQQRQQSRLNPPVLEAAMKRAFGPQQVTVSGVPTTSHFARVLVAADYRMKRLAMKLEKASVPGLPSYLDLINGRAANNANPRWWMACDYEPLAASADGLAWELRGPGVKVMTEDEFVNEDGSVRASGRTSAPAQRWADMMTGKYDSLSVEDTVFGELRNLMDMCVVAALLENNQLLEKAGLSIPILTQQDSAMKLEQWNAPTQVAPEVSFLRTRGAWVVTASGGVQVESWHVATRTEVSETVGAIRSKAAKTGQKSLWWQ